MSGKGFQAAGGALDGGRHAGCGFVQPKTGGGAVPHPGTVDLKPREFLLITLHRAENTDDPRRIRSIVAALNELSVPAVFPMHPRTRNWLKQMELSLSNPLVQVIEPVGYLDMLRLEANAKKILTDSGGVQKEAFFLQVPVITMRDETEWVETVEQGADPLDGGGQDSHSGSRGTVRGGFHPDFFRFRGWPGG